MKNETVKIKTIGHQTHDVLHIVTEKPSDLEFIPGQAIEIFIDKKGWQNEGRPFTFTCLPKDDFLEFMIKTYPEHEGVTNELLSLKAGDSLIVNDVFGDISYQGEGTFIAGGAGVTPFIAILRDLKHRGKLGNNKLLFANKSQEDIILREELETMLGQNFVNILSEEKTEKYFHGQITEAFIKEHANPTNAYFYLCGPPPMMEAVEKQLQNLKVTDEKIIKEAY
ncbi:flavodoxin reductase [Vitellibacter sp. q18]|nr:flavodoxin reductase [Aequorivita lutea]